MTLSATSRPSAAAASARRLRIRALVALGIIAVLTGAAATPAAAVMTPSVGGAAPSVGTGSQPAGARRCEQPVVARPVHTATAVAALGRRLASVAAANGTTAAALASRLRTDATLWLDRCGVAFYVDKRPERSGEATTTAQSSSGQAAATAPYAYSSTFALHSRSGSARVLYLDFNGQDISGTGWNSVDQAGGPFRSPPFDTDGSPSTFSAAEQDVVQSVWQRVAEDYAPFDIDVTTAEPGADRIDRASGADPYYGTRVVVTNARGIGSTNCDCGGRAYVGVFDEPYDHAHYQPAFVFAPAVQNVTKSIAEAASHEAGHNLGLSHDGTGGVEYYTGQGLWAPIMGAGYFAPLTQWSRGEYSGASNSENDVAVIASHGATVRADDHGDTASTATALPSASPTAGVIATASDTDWFAFSTVGGATTVTVAPATVAPDLDASLTVYAADGYVVASANPTAAFLSTDTATGLGASVALSLPAGRYSVKVDGVGSGSPAFPGYSDYASLGRYSVAVSTPRTVALLTVSTGSLPGATRGTAYSTRLASTGGTGPYAWTVSGGRLPPGLGLQAAGALSGRPTNAGRYPITLTVRDSAGRTASRGYTLVVSAPPARNDFTGDGRSDPAVFRPANGTWYVRGMAAVGYGKVGDVPVAADYTGDGRTDIALWRPSTATWYVRGGAAAVYGARGDIAIVGDFTGDRRADVAVWRPSTGVWYVRGRTPVTYGRAGDVPVAADYTGDGRTDIAVWRPSTGTFYVRGAVPVHWGVSGDTPVTGDFTGDRRADLALFRPSTATWYVRSGSTVVSGRTGDFAVSGDYDGDGRTDFAAWRPSTGTWVASGAELVTWGIRGDIPVSR